MSPRHVASRSKAVARMRAQKVMRRFFVDAAQLQLGHDGTQQLTNVSTEGWMT